MLNRVEDKFGIKPQRLVGDTNCGSAPMLGWLVEESRSHRTFRSGTNPNVTMVPSGVQVSLSMRRTIGTYVPLANI